jgi:HEAT repeat protein
LNFAAVKKHRTTLVIVFLAGLALAALFLCLNRPKEPVYNGQKLSEWMCRFDTGRWPRTGDETDAALQHIGTNALPFIIQMLHARDSKLKSAGIRALRKHSPFGFQVVDDQQKHHRAIAACYALGRRAAPALPALSDLLRRDNCNCQPFACQFLPTLGSDAEPAVPALLDMLNNRKNPLRFWAAEALRQGWCKSNLTIPALMRALSDPDPFTPRSAALAISEYGYNAKAAIPALTALLNDPAFKARAEVIDVLKHIGGKEAIEAH